MAHELETDVPEAELGASCPLVVVLSTPLGGIVPCVVDDCSGKVTRHGMIRTAIGLRLPMPTRLYWCDDHGPDDAPRTIVPL